jgi:histidinol-phosphate phosphatase family protein
LSALDQVVIPCGGPGLRLKPKTGDLPKVLTPIDGRPLLAHLLNELHTAGAKQALLLAGLGGEQVSAEARHLAPPGMDVETIIEPQPRGTAGALQGVADRLAERFMLVFGDIFTCLDWKRLSQAAEANLGLATLLVHRSSHPQDSDRLSLDDGNRVIGWIGRNGGHKGEVVTDSTLTNSAVAVFHKDILRRVPRGRPSDLFGEILPAMIEAREPIFGYRSSEYVRDIGTPARLNSIVHDVASGKTKLRAEMVLLDRDGTLIEDVGLLHEVDKLSLLPGAAKGLRLLNQAGIKVALTTNQPVVARGLCSLHELGLIHERLDELLALEDAHLDRIYFCPHHPETDHPEGDSDLRGPCKCRKPAVGMARSALADLGVPAWRTVVIGDRSVDMQLAHNAGLAAIGLETGAGCRDERFPSRPVWSFTDMLSAARWLCAGEPDSRSNDGL